MRNAPDPNGDEIAGPSSHITIHPAVSMKPVITIVPILVAVASWSGCATATFPASNSFLRWDTLDPQPRLDGIERLRQRAYRDLKLLVAARSVHFPRDLRQWILAWRQKSDHRPLVVDCVLILHHYTLPTNGAKQWSAAHYYRHPQDNDDWYLDDLATRERQVDGIAFYDHAPDAAQIIADTRWELGSGFVVTRGAVREQTWMSLLKDPPIDVSR
jgi:hypothetical protein